MKVLLDTHALVWLVEGLDELGSGARQAIDASRRDHGVAISAVTFWEVALLVARGRIDLARPVHVWRERVLEQRGVSEVQLSGDVAVESAQLPGAFHADPADRFLVATARVHGMRLATRDGRILAYGEGGHVTTLAV